MNFLAGDPKNISFVKLSLVYRFDIFCVGRQLYWRVSFKLAENLRVFNHSSSILKFSFAVRSDLSNDVDVF
jgi:hypothetical protein